MSTNTADETNGEAQNGGERSPGLPVSRRTFLRGTAATGATVAGLSTLGTGPVAAQTDDGRNYETTDDQELRNFVSINNNLYAMQTPSKREAVGMLYLASGMGVISAGAAGVTDPDHNTADYIHEYLFGPFEVETEDPTEQVVEDQVYFDLQEAQMILEDMYALAGQVDDLFPEAYDVIEGETITAIESGENAASAKSRVRQKVREDVFVNWQRNYIQVAEQYGVRLTGIFSYLVEAEAAVNDSNWTPTGDWTVHLHNSTGTGEEDTVNVHIINPSNTREIDLVDGSTYDVKTMNVVFEGETGVGWEFVPFLKVHDWFADDATLGEHIEPLDWWSWGSNITSANVDDVVTSLRYNHPDEPTFDVWLTSGRSPMHRTNWLNDHGSAEVLYERFLKALTTIDNEIDTFVDAYYSKYDPGDHVKPEDRSAGAAAYRAGYDWGATGETGLGAFARQTLGLNGGDGPATVKVWRGTDAANIDLAAGTPEPDETYENAYPVFAGDGESLEGLGSLYVSDDVSTDTDLSTMTGVIVDKPYNADATAIESAEVWHETGVDTLDPGDAFAVTRAEDADGNQMTAIPLVSYAPADLNTANLEDLYERRADAWDDYENRPGANAGEGGGGAVIGDGGIDPITAALAALAALLGLGGLAAAAGGDS